MSVYVFGGNYKYLFILRLFVIARDAKWVEFTLESTCVVWPPKNACVEKLHLYIFIIRDCLNGTGFVCTLFFFFFFKASLTFLQLGSALRHSQSIFAEVANCTFVQLFTHPSRQGCISVSCISVTAWAKTACMFALKECFGMCCQEYFYIFSRKTYWWETCFSIGGGKKKKEWN